jgi:N-acyl-D-aspartate/D-glutamate deacylase
MYDLIIRGGTLVDGTGRPARGGDLAVEDGRIAAVGEVVGPARRSLAADGLVVAPGFIDLHTHYDAQILWDPLATSSGWHGVTSVIAGSCSYAIAPCKPADRDYVVQLMSRVEAIPIAALQAGVDWAWGSFGDYLAAAGRRLGVNFGAYVGHSPLRYYAMGEAACERPARPDELATMTRLLEEALDAGAFGFSANANPLEEDSAGRHVPSYVGGAEERVALAKVLRGRRAGNVCTLISGSFRGLSADDRATLHRLAEASRKPVLWNVMGESRLAPGTWRDDLAFCEEMAAAGLPVQPIAMAQRFDWEFRLRFTYVLRRWPTWHALTQLPDAERDAFLAAPGVRARLRTELDAPPASLMYRGLDNFYVNHSATPAYRALEGRRLIDLAAERGTHAADLALEIARAEKWDTEFAFLGSVNGDDASVAEIIRHPLVLIGESDGGAHVTDQVASGLTSLVLAKWVREQGAFSLEEAIRRLTDQPARVLGLQDRGRLAPGLAADIVVFDPTAVRIRAKRYVRDYPAGEGRLIEEAEGYHYTLVNGEVLFDHGEHTGALPGRVLRNC